MYECKVVADSTSPAGDRITTFELEYPRFIHAQLLTHRVFSRNSQSNRAVPTERLLEKVTKDPVVPAYWGTNQRGMVAGGPLSVKAANTASYVWRKASRDAVKAAETLLDFGVHKQVVNRLLEPFQTIRTIVTATEWSNFLKLRLHYDTQPEMQFLAELIRQDLADSVPVEHNNWHIPYDNHENNTFDDVVSAVARCARVSYLNHYGEVNLEADKKLFDRLYKDMHLSPFEHVAKPKPGVNNNFRGWESFRSSEFRR